MVDLTDKVAVVTGASSGIGAGIVKELLQLGLKVVGLARRTEKIEEMGKEYEGKLFVLKTDVTKEEDILNAINWVDKNVGHIYVLINNAGIAVAASIDKAVNEDLRRVINTNLMAVMLFTKEAITSMKANGVDGIIININSVDGHYVPRLPGYISYITSKFGVTGFTESIRLELANDGSKIRITSICPGLVESEMTEEFLNDHPYIKSKDIANGVKYILMQPSNVNIAEIIIRPVGETF